uniref:Uncharacterized protein n=2 Tax=Ursus TaxID=9639 RepID=A0A452T8U8_URSMA
MVPQLRDLFLGNGHLLQIIFLNKRQIFKKHFFFLPSCFLIYCIVLTPHTGRRDCLASNPLPT